MNQLINYSDMSNGVLKANAEIESVKQRRTDPDKNRESQAKSINSVPINQDRKNASLSSSISIRPSWPVGRFASRYLNIVPN